MLNPFTRNRKYLYSYILVWFVLTVAQILLIYFFYSFSFLEALADGLVFNGSYALLALLIWFVVRYSDLENQGWFIILLNHFATLAILTFVWVFTGAFLLKFTFGFSDEFKNFIDDSFVWRFISGVFLYLVIVLIYYVIIYYDNFQEKIKKEAELNLMLKETELNALKSQINPHFLFNSLNSISSLTLSEPAKARNMIIKLSEYMRYSLANDETNRTSFSVEFDNATTYLEIEKIRFGDKLCLENEIEANCLHNELPAMILQPLYENAIKHGVYESTEKVVITTKCICTEQGMEITISNNFDKEAIPRKGAGIGLNNVKRRMKLIYGRTDLVKIYKSETLFEISLFFPLV